MTSARVLVFLIAAMFLFFIGESLSDRTDVRSVYPHGVALHQRDMSAYSAMPIKNVMLHTNFMVRDCDDLHEGIVRIGCNTGPL